MNSLEYIEKEIDTYNQLKERAILRIADEDDETELYKLQRHIDTLNKRIPIFQQIKAELEAWYVVKDKTMGNDYYYEIIIYKSEKDDYKKFEKALEVKENDS